MLTPAYEDTSIAVQDPKIYRCAPDQYIKSFQLAAVHTDLIVGNADSQFGTTYLGSISAECSDGEQLPTVRSSEDTDSNCNNLKHRVFLEDVHMADSDAGFTGIDYR